MSQLPIIALDFSSQEEIADFLAQFPTGEKLFLKVGMELFYQEGPTIVRWLKSLGHWVFLDLKLHDIPNTVGAVMAGLARLGVDMTNVHAAGGYEMMVAAKEGLTRGTPAGASVPLLIAVTQLTSTTEAAMQAQQLISVSLKESVSNYAHWAQQAALDGVVCSAHEVGLIKAATTPEFACITPGIRPEGSEVGDQKRIMTPAAARTAGADYIVVGRPITQAADPYQAYVAIKNQWNGAY